MATDIFSKSWRNIEIEQQTQYGFTADYIKPILDNWASVDKYAFIVQDKCRNDDGTLKEIHIHCMIAFKSPVPTTAILNKFNPLKWDEYTDKSPSVDNNGLHCSDSPIIGIGQLEKIKSWDGAIAYLTHENKANKTQYSRDEVIANYDFNADIDRALQPIKDARLIDLLDAIDSGKLRSYNISDYVSIYEYDKYCKHIDTALKYHNQKLVRNGAMREMEVIFCTGDSGTGKTTYCKDFCEDNGLSYFVSSGSNDVLDGYGGQDAIILDELRGSTMGLSDLLKLLDNNTNSTIKSRYLNKNIAYCKYIFITSVLDINEFFKNVFKEQEETIVQLKRRCKQYFKFTPTRVEIFLYDSAKRDYVTGGSVDNPVALKYKASSLTDEQKANIVNRFFKDANVVVSNIVKNQETIGEWLNISDSDNPFL